MSQTQADGASRGGIRPSTPAYFFWMKFLENQPELRNEFQWRIMHCDGFIDWDFLPKLENNARLPKGVQYRRALGCVRETIDLLCSSDLATVDSSHLVGRIGFLTSLGDLTDQILVKRRNNIYTHDTLANRVVESYSSKTPNKNHKEVYDLWKELRDAITRSVDILTNELKRRGRSASGVQQIKKPTVTSHQAVRPQAVRPQTVRSQAVRPQAVGQQTGRQNAPRQIAQNTRPRQRPNDAEEDSCCVIL